MARDDSFDARRRQRELEDQKDEGELGPRLKGQPQRARTGDASIDKLLELLSRAEPMIEQINNLYNQYVVGVEQRPPIERRKQLEQVMATLQAMSKPTPAYQFRYTSLNASYMTHRDRWDRLTKDLESGKIKRATGPKRT